MTRPKEITKKLKGADPEISTYIVELERVNFRLQKQIGKLQAMITTKDNEIKALKQAQPRVLFKMNLGKSPDMGSSN